MNPFPLPLIIEDVGTKNGTQVFKLKEPFRYVSFKYGDIVVPAGFESTGASIPRVFWSIMSPVGSYFYSSLFHDLGYSKSCPYKMNRKEVDDMFLECMKVQKVSFITRTTIYTAVRTFGWKFYKKN